MNKLFLLSLFGLTLLTGCVGPKINAFSQYLTFETLASYPIQTPDPRKQYPWLGQRIVINWSVTSEDLNCEDLHLELTVRLANNEERQVMSPICQLFGGYYYDVVNTDYFDAGGILTYKVELVGNNEVIDRWKHQLWVERISFEDPPKVINAN